MTTSYDYDSAEFEGEMCKLGERQSKSTCIGDSHLLPYTNHSVNGGQGWEAKE